MSVQGSSEAENDAETATRLAAVLAGADAVARLPAARKLAGMETPWPDEPAPDAVLAVLVHALGDPDASLRRMVATALGALGDGRVVWALTGALAGERDTNVRQELANALEQLLEGWAGDTAVERSAAVRPGPAPKSEAAAAAARTLLRPLNLSADRQLEATGALVSIRAEPLPGCGSVVGLHAHFGPQNLLVGHLLVLAPSPTSGWRPVWPAATVDEWGTAVFTRLVPGTYRPHLLPPPAEVGRPHAALAEDDLVIPLTGSSTVIRLEATQALVRPVGSDKLQVEVSGATLGSDGVFALAWRAHAGASPSTLLIPLAGRATDGRAGVSLRRPEGAAELRVSRLGVVPCARLEPKWADAVRASVRLDRSAAGVAAWQAVARSATVPAATATAIEAALARP